MCTVTRVYKPVFLLGRRVAVLKGEVIASKAINTVGGERGLAGASCPLERKERGSCCRSDGLGSRGPVSYAAAPLEAPVWLLLFKPPACIPI